MSQTPESELARLKEKAAAFDAIERLRKNEGACVWIVCDNPEADETHDTTYVLVIDEWTRWQGRAFYGPTLPAALATAEHERTLARSEK